MSYLNVFITDRVYKDILVILRLAVTGSVVVLIAFMYLYCVND